MLLWLIFKVKKEESIKNKVLLLLCSHIFTLYNIAFVDTNIFNVANISWPVILFIYLNGIPLNFYVSILFTRYENFRDVMEYYCLL